jgi:hypothetical protein
MIRRARALTARASAATAALAAAALSLTLASGVEAAPIEGIHKIQHVVMIMQENRSRTSAPTRAPTGFPQASACQIRCMAAASPYHNPRDENYVGPMGPGIRSAAAGTGCHLC